MKIVAFCFSCKIHICKSLSSRAAGEPFRNPSSVLGNVFSRPPVGHSLPSGELQPDRPAAVATSLARINLPVFFIQFSFRFFNGPRPAVAQKLFILFPHISRSADPAT